MLRCGPKLLDLSDLVTAGKGWGADMIERLRLAKVVSRDKRANFELQGGGS